MSSLAEKLAKQALLLATQGLGAAQQALAAIGGDTGLFAALTADLYGTGQDGAGHISAPAPNFLGGNYTTFLLDAGITATAKQDVPIIIRATQSITINGVLNAAGANVTFQPGAQIGAYLVGRGGGGGGGGGDAAGTNTGFGGLDDLGVRAVVNNAQTATIAAASIPLQVESVLQMQLARQFLTVGTPAPTSYSQSGSGGLGGAHGGGVGGTGAGATDATGVPNLLFESFRELRPSIRAGAYSSLLVGGAPGAPGMAGGTGGLGSGAAGGGLPGAGGAGGAGGGAIYLIAPVITFGPASQINVSGTNGVGGSVGGTGVNGGANQGGGGGGGGGAGGQGGSAGVVVVLAGVTLTQGGLVIFDSPGTGGTGAVGGNGGNAGSGGAGAGGPGGQGADGVTSLGLAFTWLNLIGAHN